VNFSIRNALIEANSHSAQLLKPWLLGRDVKRYQPPTSRNYLIYSPWELQIDAYPAIKAHLENWKQELAARPEVQAGRYQWWCMSRYGAEFVQEYSAPKIIAPAIVQRAAFTFDDSGHYSNDKTSIICGSDLFYLLGVLNSSPSDFFLRLIASTKQGGYFEQKPVYLAQIPIPRLDLSNPADIARHDRIVARVDEMLALQRALAEAERTLDDARGDLVRRCARVDRELDGLVYELYGLTAAEIKLVEGEQ
jgi:hypothetical protein